MRKTWASTALGVVAAVLVAACGFAGSGTGTGTGGHGTGPTGGAQAQSNLPECGKADRTIKSAYSTTRIKGQPKRIVALELSFVDALSQIGVTPVGVADDNDASRIIPQIRSRIGSYTSVGLRQSPNLEVITSLHPDLILADPVRDKAIESQLTQIAPTIVLPSLQETYQQDLDSMALIGEAMNQCQKMQSRLNAHAAFMQREKAKVPRSGPKRFLFAVIWDKGFNAHNSEAYTPGVLKALGYTDVLTGTPGNPYNDMTLETLVQANPPILLLAPQTKQTVVDQWKTSSLWQGIDAVKTHRVYTVDQVVWSKSRGITSAELIAQQLISAVSSQGS